MNTDQPAKWFRMYAEFATDPKVQILSETDQRRYLMLLCMRCSNGNVTLQDEIIAFQLRICNEEWLQTKATLLHKNLIDDDNKPTAWEKRQYASDSSKSRVSKHRENKKRQCNVTVTAKKRSVETETETETEIKKEEPSSSQATDVIKRQPEEKTEMTTKSEKMCVTEFREAYRQATGEMLPGGLYNKATELCWSLPRDKLEDAFEQMAMHGGKTFKYLLEVLKGKPKKTKTPLPIQCSKGAEYALRRSIELAEQQGKGGSFLELSA